MRVHVFHFLRIARAQFLIQKCTQAESGVWSREFENALVFANPGCAVLLAEVGALLSFYCTTSHFLCNIIKKE